MQSWCVWLSVDRVDFVGLLPYSPTAVLNIMTKETYRRKSLLWSDSFRGLESMAILMGSMEAGKCGARAADESLYLDAQAPDGVGVGQRQETERERGRKWDKEGGEVGRERKRDHHWQWHRLLKPPCSQWNSSSNKTTRIQSFQRVSPTWEQVLKYESHSPSNHRYTTFYFRCFNKMLICGLERWLNG